MMEELCSLAEKGSLRAPVCTEAAFTDGQFQEALDRSMQPFIGAKQVFNMQI